MKANKSCARAASNMKMRISTLLFTVILLFIDMKSTKSTSAWMSLRDPSMMKAPPTLWRTPQDIRYYFGQISEHLNIPNVHLFDSVNNDEKVFYHDRYHCINTSVGLRIGVAVVQQKNLTREVCKTLQQPDCNASIVLFVASTRCTCVTLGLNTSSIVDTRCHHALNQMEQYDNKNIVDCFKHIIEPRITIYEQLLNGTHHCYIDAPDINHNIKWILIGCGMFAFLTLTVGTVYGFVHLKKQSVVREQKEPKNQKCNDEELKERDTFITPPS